MQRGPEKYARSAPLRKRSPGRKKDPACVLVGERHGRKIEGCDLGNSPSSIDSGSVRNKRVIHTTSAGTQGIVNAVQADRVITGSFVNARAIADYIRETSPETVSLVCMGKEGIAPAEEDELCAIYLKNLLTIGRMPEIDRKLSDLRTGGGSHFFDPSLREVYPEQDFWECISRDRFDFVLKIEKDPDGYIAKKVNV